MNWSFYLNSTSKQITGQYHLFKRKIHLEQMVRFKVTKKSNINLYRNKNLKHTDICIKTFAWTSFHFVFHNTKSQPVITVTIYYTEFENSKLKLLYISESSIGHVVWSNVNCKFDRYIHVLFHILWRKTNGRKTRSLVHSLARTLFKYIIRLIWP